MYILIVGRLTDLQIIGLSFKSTGSSVMPSNARQRYVILLLWLVVI